MINMDLLSLFIFGIKCCPLLSKMTTLFLGLEGFQIPINHLKGIKFSSTMGMFPSDYGDVPFGLWMSLRTSDVPF